MKVVRDKEAMAQGATNATQLLAEVTGGIPSGFVSKDQMVPVSETTVRVLITPSGLWESLRR